MLFTIEWHYAKCRCAKCHYVECRGAIKVLIGLNVQKNVTPIQFDTKRLFIQLGSAMLSPLHLY
jgi:hypothetical protein